MPQPNDLDDPVAEEAILPRAWIGPPVSCDALDAECTCPVDCPRDHEYE